MALAWKIHGDGATLSPGESVSYRERLSWPRTIGLGVQHAAAMFGPTFVVPLLMGLDARVAVMMSGICTIMFLLIVNDRVPSYLGTSGAFVGSVAVVRAQPGAGSSDVTGAILVAGAATILLGALIHYAGAAAINRLVPPVVTGTILMIIGFNLAPVVARTYWPQDQWVALLVTVFTVVCPLALRGFLGRMAIFLGLVFGFLVSWFLDIVDGPITSLVPGVGSETTHMRISWEQVHDAAWLGFPSGSMVGADGKQIAAWVAPHISVAAVLVILPAVVALAAETVGHVFAISETTGENLDDMVGRSVVGVGVGTLVASAVGGSPVTTYGENIGIMAATRVFSSATYYVAAVIALIFGFSPKFGALFAAIPGGVLAGTTAVLYGMIGLVGVLVWLENGVSFNEPVNLFPTAAAVIIGIGDTTLHVGDSFALSGISLGTLVAILGYHVCRVIAPAHVEGPAAESALPGADDAVLRETKGSEIGDGV